MRKVLLYTIAIALYLLGIWFHFPYGGGHVYSDIATVFQVRECLSNGICDLRIPYLQVFIEYPVIVSVFMYVMAFIGSGGATVVQGDTVIVPYYYLTCAFLAVPTFLLIREVLKISKILGISRGDGRVLLYIIATPTFIFMLLLNWYVIGVFFMVFALRKFLQGSVWSSAALLGLSAASNVVTVVPTMAIVYKLDSWRKRGAFIGVVGAVFALVNSPFVLLNPTTWESFWTYHANWYTEGSWMNAFFANTDSMRHFIFPSLFAVFTVAILFRLRREKTRQSSEQLTVTASWLLMFAFLFTTYVFTPQMNLILVPFFALAPILRRYWEFLAFDIVNSLVIVWGFSQVLLFPFGITYHVQDFGYASPIQWLAIIRSAWVGKILIVDGLLLPRRPSTIGVGRVAADHVVKSIGGFPRMIRRFLSEGNAARRPSAKSAVIVGRVHQSS